MDIVELLRSEDLYLPKEHKGNNFPDFLNGLFQNYIIKIEQLNDSTFSEKIKDKIPIIKELIECLKEAVNKYYQGDPNNGYRSFSSVIDLIKDYLKFNFKDITPETYPKLKMLYRIRLGNNIKYSQKEMFHIPFGQRTKVTLQRYSIAGLPCLYLGSSAYICWEELGRPNFGDVQIVRLSIKNENNVKILDIGYTPTYLASQIESLIQTEDTGDTRFFYNKIYFEDQVVNIFVTWPLVAACSIKVHGKNDPFKPEYIIPQMFLQWVRFSKEYDGIKYFTVNLSRDSYSSEIRHMGLFQNYVFPAKDSVGKGLCTQLKKKFEITDPISWTVALTHEIKKLNYPLWYPKEDRIIELIKGYSVNYSNTNFGYIEKVLLNQETTAIR